MAVTVVVRSGAAPKGRELALTLDAPRLVLGRGDGCEMRLPDPSVSHRHASLRQKGGEWMLVDEGSLNGTWIGRVRLPPQTPRAIRSGELVRLGRIWLEIRIEAAVVGRGGAAAAKEIALDLVAQSLAASGEEPGPRATVVEGPDRGAAFLLAEPERAYVLGRSRDCDFVLTDSDAGRRHATLERRGDAIAVHDLGSPRTTLLDGAQVGPAEALWRPGLELVVANTRLALDYPAADALLEIERGPDERMPGGEAAEPPAARAATPAPTETAPIANVETSDAGLERTEPTETELAADRNRRDRNTERGWGAVDGFVILLALGVLVVSLVAGFWMLKH